MLLDTNIFLELLLDQDKADKVENFLRVSEEELYISDFSLYSIGIILFRYGKHEVFTQFVEDVLINGGIKLIRLSPPDMKEVVNYSKRFKLGYDDAYQYAVAERYGLEIVSFDSDFDNTEKGRKILD